MKALSFPRCAAAAILFTLAPLLADDPGPVPVLESTTYLGGTRSKVVWSPQSNVRYRVEKSTWLDGGGGSGGWVTQALVEGGEWTDPEPPGTRAFYRVPAPEPEVFAVEPAVVARSGGILTLRAQCLPPGSMLRLETPGELAILLPLMPGPDGTWRVVLNGLPPGEPVIGTLSVVDGGGVPVATVGQTLEITDSGTATEPPPVEPPASPLGMAINEKGLPGDKKPSNCACATCRNKKVHARMAGGGDEEEEECDEGTEELLNSLLMPALMKAKEKANRTKCSNNLRQPSLAVKKEEGGRHTPFHNRYRPGEVGVEQEVLRLATPAGPDLSLSLHYRSRAGTGGISSSTMIPCGNGWTCSYDLRIVPVPLAAGATAPRLHLYGGDGRRDVLVRQTDGTYTGDGMFREGRFDPDTTFRLTFADKSQCIFCPLVGAPWSGRIGSIADANGVAITFTYDAASKLVQVASQFGQSLTLGYDATGALSTATDHTGRSVQCVYYGAGEPGGSAGDLKSVSCPQAPGALPLEGPATFTYSTGSTDARLNHNLLSARDGGGRLLQEFTYSPVTNAADIEFDMCDSVNRDRVILSGNVTLCKFEIPPSVPGSPVAYRCLINDPVGRVTEIDYDAHHREIACREYTGFAAPGVVTTSSSNRPNPDTKRRASDPPYYETTCAYNPDHRIKNRRHADGTQELITFERELIRESPTRRTGGNARIITLRTAGGDERTVYCDYEPGFGTNESHGNKPVSKSSSNIQNNFSSGGGGGGEWNPLFEGDAQSNPIPGVGIVVKRLRPPASSSSVAGSPIGGLSIKGGRNPKPPGAARMLDGGGGVWDGGDGEGGCTESARGVDRDGKDCTDPRRPKLGGHMTRLTTSHGQVFTWTYDVHGNCTSSRTPVAGSGCDIAFNSLGQCTSVTVLNGPGSSFREEFTYDIVDRWPSGRIVDPDLSGTGAGLHITTTCETDALGRITRVVDPLGHDWLTEYDACDRVTVSRTPAVGTATPARISTNFYYDLGGECVRCDMEHRDETGALVAANPTYTAWAVHDSRLHLSRLAVEQRPVDAGPANSPVDGPPLLNETDYAICDFTYNDSGECIECRVPAASRGQSMDKLCLSYYDERGQEWKCQDGMTGAPGTTTVQYDYTPTGMVARRLLLLSGPVGDGQPFPEELFAYDGFQRLTSVTDPMGNVTQYEYDEQGFTTVSVFGEVSDLPGSAGNVLLARHRVRKGMQDIKNRLRESPTMSHHRESPTKSRLRESPTKSRLRESPTRPTMVRLRESPTRPSTGRYRPAFFDIFVADDVCTSERFAPGAPAPHATETTSVNRSPAGLCTTVTTNGDLLLTCTYDTAGRSTGCSNAACTVSCTLNARGEVLVCGRTDHFRTAGTPGKTFTSSRTIDALGRVTSSSDGGGNNENWRFDGMGRVTQNTDPRGVVHRFRYDGETGGSVGTPPALFTCLHECDADNDGDLEVLSHALYGGNEELSCTDSNGHTITCVRDSAGNLVQCDFPDGTHETYGFDNFGRPNSITHQDGTVTTATHNLCGETEHLLLSGGSPGTIPVAPTEYRYNGLGQLVQCDQGDSHLVFTCDSLGNQLSESHNGLTITRTFTHRGRSSITYPDGTRFLETRDELGLLTSVSRAAVGGGALQPPISTVTWLGLRPSSETRANGVVTTHEYRGDGDAPLPGSIEDFSFDECVRTDCTNGGGTVLSSIRVRRDAAQNVIQCDTIFSGVPQSPGRRHLQGYNRLGHLNQSTIQRREVAGGPLVQESLVTYALDLEGRRLNANGGSNPGAYTQNAAVPPADQQMGHYSTWPGGPLEWDDQGCLTSFSRGTSFMQCTYDQASRLVATTDFSTGAPVQTTYAYDAMSRRTRSSTASSDPLLPPVDTFFVYDGATCVQELGGDGLPNVTMAAAGGLHLCISSRNGTLVYPHGGGPKESGTSAYRLKVWQLMQGQSGTEAMRWTHLVPRAHHDIRLFVSPAGAVTERTDCDDAGMPIFLTSDGMPRPGATSTLLDYRWMAPESIWCPESRFFQYHGGVYSPELGTGVSNHKEKPKPKPKPIIRSHEFTGHVTLMK